MQMDLPGLLALTSEALYSEPEIAFRELAQNAHDAIRRRQLAAGEHHAAPAGRLNLRFEEGDGRRYVTFEDDGAGLSADEAREFLATIGRGQTGGLRRDDSHSDTADLIGQFGVGLLAAFLVADRVEVESRRFDLPPEDGVRWVNEGQQTYRLESWHGERAGTRVRLRMRTDAHHLGTEAAVRAALERWARYLDLPITFPTTGPLRAAALPWRDQHAHESVRAGLEFALAASWGEARPRALVRLRPFTHDGRHVELHGLVVFGERAAPGRTHGTTEVLIRRMVVERENRSLLPSWAGMARAMVECADLLPTASRESVRRDALHDAIAAAIEQQLLAALANLRMTQPEQHRELVQAHREAFLEHAGQHAALFECVADDLLVFTTDGPLTVDACLAQGDGMVRYYRDGGDLETVSVLAAGSGWVIIDARSSALLGFLTMYVRRRGVPAQLFDPRAQARTLVNASPALARLRQWAATDTLRVELADLQPAALPALVVEDWDAYHDRRAREAMSKPDTTNAVRDILGTLAPKTPVGPSTVLLLNASNPLVLRIAGHQDEQRARAALTTLVMQARLLGEKRPHGSETMSLYAQLSEALDGLL